MIPSPYGLTNTLSRDECLFQESRIPLATGIIQSYVEKVGTIFAIEIVKGRDRPSEHPDDSADGHGKTIGLMLRLCKYI